MNRLLYHSALGMGLLVVGWIAAGYVGTNPLALTMTLLVAAFYAMGALELHRFRIATAGLARALAALPQPLPALAPWLAQVPAALQPAVRGRIEGERAGLPGPALTPYLTGLLVLLGMLGTFLGMVATLKGTGAAIAGATDLQAMRASLTAPVQGLGLAFGTSVAGVAASAMLGLMSALARRERLQAAQQLDARVATSLRAFSPAHQREESLKLLQQQAALMPRLVDRLEALMTQIERQAQDANAQLVAGQTRFHAQAEAAYANLAASVDRSLKQSLVDSARAAGDTIRPAVETVMAGIARETQALQAALASSVQQQLDGASARFEAATTAVAGTWQATLAEHRRGGEALAAGLRASLDGFAQTFEQRSAALLAAVNDAQGRSQAALAAGDEQRLAAWRDALSDIAVGLRQEWQQAGEQALQQQRELCHTLERSAREVHAQAGAQAQATIDEVARLVQAAAEAPRAAAAVIGELREQLSASMAHDNALLEERARLMETLATLLDAVNRASTDQRAAIEALLASSADVLERAGARFGEQVDAQGRRIEGVAAQLTGSAVEVASLGEAFGAAVDLFGESNRELVAQLQRIEGALAQQLARSDEQLAYYVAQAREVIDLSLMSQKQIVEDLQRLSSSQPAPVRSPALAASEA
jgi:hypothetical protein